MRIIDCYECSLNLTRPSHSIRSLSWKYLPHSLFLIYKHSHLIGQFNVLHEVILVIMHAFLSLPWQLLFTGCSLHLQVQSNKVWGLHWRGGSSGSPRLLLPWYRAWHQPSTAPLTGLSAGQVQKTMWVKETCWERPWNKLILMSWRIIFVWISQHCKNVFILPFLLTFFLWSYLS